MSLVNLAAVKRTLAEAQSCVLAGKVTRASGIVVEAILPQVAVGTSCEIRISGGYTISVYLKSFTDFGMAYAGPVPVPVIIFIGTVLGSSARRPPAVC